MAEHKIDASCEAEDIKPDNTDVDIPFGEEFKLNPSIKKVWYWHAAILVAVVVGSWSTIAHFISLAIPGFSVYVSDAIVYGILGAWILLFNVIGGILQYNFSSYTIGEDALIIKTGAFIRKTTLIPYVRIQHTGHEQGIIMNHYGLVQLTIATASATFTLDGLEKARADKLTELIAHAVEHAREDV